MKDIILTVLCSDDPDLGLDQTINEYWRELYVDPSKIEAYYLNNEGSTNIFISGEKWSVKETPEEISKMKSESLLRSFN